MHGEDRLRSLKKFSAIALVLTLGGTFHGLCWSSLVRPSGEMLRPSVVPGVDHRFRMINGADMETQKNCAQDAPKILVSNQ